MQAVYAGADQQRQYEIMAGLPTTQAAYFALLKLRVTGGLEPGTLERAQSVWDLCVLRDKLQAVRNCGCLGFGGYLPRYVPDGLGGAVRTWEVYCDCADGLADRERFEGDMQASRAALVQSRIDRVLRMVPSDWADWTLRSWVTVVGTAEVGKRLADWLDSGDWLYLWGKAGVGKSGAAWPLVREYISRGHSGAFVNVAETLNDIRGRFGNYENMRAQDKNPWGLLETAEILCLDDLGAQRNTEWAVERLYALINHRHGANLRTIITSNDDPAKLRAKMDRYDDENGARVCSRIIGKSTVVELRGRDVRVSRSKQA